MEINRDERLREMGLTPVWRRRAAGSPPGSPVVEHAVAHAAGAPAADAAATAARAPVPVAIDPVATVPVARPLLRDAPPGAVTPVAAVDAAAIFARETEIAALEWDQLAPHIAACTACGLCRTRKLTVPGTGMAGAGWMFVGEAPGAEEDAHGEPFVGQAGRLLDNMLKAIGLSRERDTFIANVLKCRPPNNRNPEPGEVVRCTPYLERQLALVKPRLIIALGRAAAMTLLNTDATVAAMRGRVHSYRGVPLIVTYHPAYLLRTLPDKARAWEDLLFAKRTFADLQSGESSPTERPAKSAP